MAGKEAYDSSLQMFIQQTNIDANKLNFWRDLAEKGKLEHPVQGPVSGEYAAFKQEVVEPGATETVVLFDAQVQTPAANPAEGTQAA